MISASTRRFTNRNPESSYIEQLQNESSALGYGPQSSIKVKKVSSINHKARVKFLFTKHKFRKILATAKSNALAGTSIQTIANGGSTWGNPLGTPPGTLPGTPPGTITRTLTGTPPATPQSVPMPPGATDFEKSLVLDFQLQMLKQTESDWIKTESDWIRLDQTGSSSIDEQKLSELQNEMAGFGLMLDKNLIKNINGPNEDNPRAKLKRKSSDSLKSDQETFKKPNIEIQDMNLVEAHDIAIEQGCENDEKTSNSSNLAAFFKLPI